MGSVCILSRCSQQHIVLSRLRPWKNSSHSNDSGKKGTSNTEEGVKSFWLPRARSRLNCGSRSFDYFLQYNFGSRFPNITLFSLKSANLQLLFHKSVNLWNTDVCIRVEASQSCSKLPGTGLSLLNLFMFAACRYEEAGAGSIWGHRLQACFVEYRGEERVTKKFRPYRYIHVLLYDVFDVSASRRLANNCSG